MPNFLPEIPKYATFEKSDLFKEWLFMKLVNAEIACCKAEKFKKLKERTRITLLEELYKELNEQNLKIMQAIQINNASCSDNSNDNVFDSNSQTSLTSSTMVSSTHSKNDATVATVNSNSHHHHHASNGFKFNLFHNVRKAFNMKSHNKSHGSESNAKTTPSNSSSSSSSGNEQIKENKPAFTLPHNLPPIYSDSLINNNISSSKGRMRSSTVDTPSPNKFLSKSLKEKAEYNNSAGKIVLPDYGKIQQNFVVNNNNNNKNSKPNKNGSQTNINEGYDKQTTPSTSSEESSPKSLNSVQNRSELLAGEYSMKKKQYNFTKSR